MLIPQGWFTNNRRRGKMEAIMEGKNETIKLPEPSGHVPKFAETSSEVPQPSADFRTIPNHAEAFGKVPQDAERKESHTLTVREVARMFEAAGVARTERSIVNWCQPNRTGIARLDSYFDPNERRYYIFRNLCKQLNNPNSKPMKYLMQPN